ncbi:MAG: hypothetical protein ABI559_08820 [Chloroflexota bacterium]
MNDPALILADEPTANLDSSHGHDTMRLLRDIANEKGRSVVIVSHDQRIKDIADRVLWLEDGQFKTAVTMATDPVCGMTVEQGKALSSFGQAARRTRPILRKTPLPPQRPPILQSPRSQATGQARAFTSLAHGRSKSAIPTAH